MKKVKFAGFDVAIETAKGVVRTGVSKDGKQWAVIMPADYGYIEGTKGVDGDEVDVFLGPHPLSRWVYVIHQLKEPHAFNLYDEDKVMLGFNSLEEAERIYGLAYGLTGLIGSATKLSLGQFRKKLKQLRGKKLHAMSAGGPGSGRHKLSSTLIRHRGVDGGWMNNGHKINAHIDGKKIGEAGVLEYNKDGNKTWKITTSRVNDNLVGKGYGKYLYGEVIKQAKLNGVNTLRSANKLSPGSQHAWNRLSKTHGATYNGKFWNLSIHASFTTGTYDDDYFQFREKHAMQPTVSKNHPPSLKNPQKVRVDNPDEESLFDELNRKHLGKKAKLRKARQTKLDDRNAASKPEIVETTPFTPITTG